MFDKEADERSWVPMRGAVDAERRFLGVVAVFVNEIEAFGCASRPVWWRGDSRPIALRPDVDLRSVERASLALRRSYAGTF